MNRLFSILICSFLMLQTANTFAQHRGHAQDPSFDRLIATLRSTTTPKARFDRAIVYFSREQATCSQLADVCSFIANDRMKYELCLEAWPRIIDKDNFFIIYDSFSKFSWAIQLYHFTQGMEVQEHHVAVETQPEYHAPPREVEVRECYTGPEQFNYIKDVVKDQRFSEKMKESAKMLIAKNCLTVDQVKEIILLFDFEDDRLEMCKYSYDYVLNPKDMYLLRETLKFNSSRQEFDEYLLGR